MDGANPFQVYNILHFTYIFFFGILYKLTDLSKNRKMKIDSRFDLSIIEDDIFLEEIKGLSHEEKALKQLSKKQVDIERYHSLNLAHTKSIFVIGVFIILNSNNNNYSIYIICAEISTAYYNGIRFYRWIIGRFCWSGFYFNV